MLEALWEIRCLDAALIEIATDIKINNKLREVSALNLSTELLLDQSEISDGIWKKAKIYTPVQCRVFFIVRTKLKT